MLLRQLLLLLLLLLLSLLLLLLLLPLFQRKADQSAKQYQGHIFVVHPTRAVSRETQNNQLAITGKLRAAKSNLSLLSAKGQEAYNALS